MIEIKSINKTELTELCEIYNSSRSKLGCYPYDEKTLSEFNALIKNEDIYVAILENKTIGFTGVCSSDKFIHHLYIRPNYQGEGVGSYLLKYCVKTYGLPLTLKCDNCNFKAQSFYKKYGLSYVSEGKGDYGTWTELAIKKKLSNADTSQIIRRLRVHAFGDMLETRETQ